MLEEIIKGKIMSIDSIIKGSCSVVVMDGESFLRMVLSGNTVYWYIHNEDYESWVSLLEDDVDYYEQAYIERER